MNKTELAAELSVRQGLSKKDSEATVDSLFDIIVETLQSGEGVNIFKTLSLDVVPTNARTARNPQTGAVVQVPAGRKVKVKLLKLLKDIK
jgi:DNA-binding protein HU-beta